MSEKRYIPKKGDRFVAINKQTGEEARVGTLDCEKVVTTKEGYPLSVTGIDRYEYDLRYWKFEKKK